MENRKNIGLMVMIAVGWWGLMFPEYSLGNSVVLKVCEEAVLAGEEDFVPEAETEMFYDLLEAGPEQIVVKSKLYESIKAVLEKS